MKLLFDENLSKSLVKQLDDLFPQSAHVSTFAKPGLSDSNIWIIAKENGYAIVSKDNDFRQRSFIHGAPPKIVWLSVGNAGTAIIADLLRNRHRDLIGFDKDTSESLLVVTLAGG